MSNANPASGSDSGERLTAFSALFHGGEAAVQIRLLAARLRPRLVAGRDRPTAPTGSRTGLSRRKPLSDHDLRRLAALRDTALPPLLRDLAEALAAIGEKGEQEGYL